MSYTHLKLKADAGCFGFGGLSVLHFLIRPELFDFLQKENNLGTFLQGAAATSYQRVHYINDTHTAKLEKKSIHIFFQEELFTSNL